MNKYKEFSSETKIKEIVEGTIEAIYNYWGTKFAPTKVLKKVYIPRVYRMVDDDDDDDNSLMFPFFENNIYCLAYFYFFDLNWLALLFSLNYIDYNYYVCCNYPLAFFSSFYFLK